MISTECQEGDAAEDLHRSGVTAGVELVYIVVFHSIGKTSIVDTENTDSRKQ